MVLRDNFRYLSEEEKATYPFSHCELCELHPCEKIGEYLQYAENNPNATSLSYNPNEYGCPVKLLNPIRCNSMSAYVADGIGEHFKISMIKDHRIGGYRIEVDEDGFTGNRTVDRWEPPQPVFLSAQTGKGKNHFIENVLITHVRALCHKLRIRVKILILSNRIALTIQMKSRLNKGLPHQEEDDGDALYSYKEYSNVLGAEYVDVMSYQSFLKKKEYLMREQGLRRNKHGEIKMKYTPKYIYVIPDESHYFTSDAMFNPETDRTLHYITMIFKNAVRVYMSATHDESLRHIMHHETKAIAQSVPGVFYHFNRDYSYLDIKYYSEFEELRGVIEDSGNENWLIFLDNKNKCRKLKEELEDIPSLKGKVYAVSAESKQDENYQRMVVEERIDVLLKGKKDEEGRKIRVLIATSVIDNGINFRNIQNVVVSDFSKVKCLQMLGRARVSKGERVTLYIKRFTENEISYAINRLEVQREAYHDYRTLSQPLFFDKYYTGSEENWVNAKHWFGMEDGTLFKLFPNEIAVSLANTLVTTYQAVLDEMQRSNPDELPGQKYLQYQLSWFGKKYSRENDITLKDKDEGLKSLLEFLGSYADNRTKIAACDQNKFREELTGLIDNTFGKQDKNNRTYGVDKIDKVFEKCNICYKIHKIRGTTGARETYWTVVRSQRNEKNA